MNEEVQKRIITIMSTALASLLASKLADVLLDEPEERGVRDDVKEAMLKAGFSLVATIIASFVIRNVVSRRWGN
ncbi:MAG: hypothetical protein M3397_04980 [Actinomycetota bacterium]|nr:hypothetical protein [Rubrobacter sp.]MBA3791631.1 hypothetical protein [Rubrobacter sp.]MDQ3567419.1 hypothetical protein [Actinomycetota bacterium]MDQ3659081.1 hypothetical protein [Actinomycetota bacterium]